MEEEFEDMGQSPLIEDGRFKKGTSGNPAGRPKGSKSKVRSKMRTQLANLCELQEASLDILRISLTGKDKEGNEATVPKDKVDMAKFIVNKIESLNKTCLQEEMAILNVADKNEENARTLSENQAEATETGAFSLEMDENEFKQDDEEDNE